MAANSGSSTGPKTPVLVHNASCTIQISKGRWDHIWKGHVKRKLKPHQSKFNTTSKAKIQSMIDRALDKHTSDGDYFYKFPESIGKVMKDGVAETQEYIRVVVRNGKIITAYPSDALWAARASLLSGLPMLNRVDPYRTRILTSADMAQFLSEIDTTRNLVTDPGEQDLLQKIHRIAARCAEAAALELHLQVD